MVVVSETKAYVTNWGGEHPKQGEPQALSSKTQVRIDPKTGVAASGSVSVVDLKAGKTVKAIATGLHPSGLALSTDRQFLYVACANSDTVAVINTETDELVETITVRPEARLPFGSGPNALAPSADGGFALRGQRNQQRSRRGRARTEGFGTPSVSAGRAGPPVSSQSAGIPVRSWSAPAASPRRGQRRRAGSN